MSSIIATEETITNKIRFDNTAIRQLLMAENNPLTISQLKLTLLKQTTKWKAIHLTLKEINEAQEDLDTEIINSKAEIIFKAGELEMVELKKLQFIAYDEVAKQCLLHPSRTDSERYVMYN
jgi:hypothetical protein